MQPSLTTDKAGVQFCEFAPSTTLPLVKWMARCSMLLAICVGWNGAAAGTFNLLVENDAFAATDRHYTNGVQISYLSDPMGEDGKYSEPNADEPKAFRFGWRIGQSIFTPTDTEATALLPEQRPYAGWLYAGASLVRSTAYHVDTLSLTVGTIGPDAKGEEVQNGFHELIDSDEHLGWDNQLANKVGGEILIERKWRALAQTKMLRLGIDLMPHVGIAAGNIEAYANTGFTIRIGNDLDNDFGPPRIRPSLPGSAFFMPHDKLAWYLFAGIDGRYVERNLLLTGHGDTKRPQIELERWVADAQAGLAVTLGGFRLAYTFVYRSEEFKQQVQPDRFGSVALTFLF